VYEPHTWTNLGAIFLLGLTTARHENRKIRYENELLKAKEPAPDVYKCRIYRMTPKTCHEISWDYPFKFAYSIYRNFQFDRVSYVKKKKKHKFFLVRE
jgi:hypothetical protein